MRSNYGSQWGSNYQSGPGYDSGYGQFVNPGIQFQPPGFGGPITRDYPSMMAGGATGGNPSGAIQRSGTLGAIGDWLSGAAGTVGEGVVSFLRGDSEEGKGNWKNAIEVGKIGAGMIAANKADKRAKEELELLKKRIEEEEKENERRHQRSLASDWVALMGQKQSQVNSYAR